ncbi:MAG: hypothetical protein ACLFUO_05610 [Candidatus Woesearchaeota archaeon]
MDGCFDNDDYMSFFLGRYDRGKRNAQRLSRVLINNGFRIDGDRVRYEPGFLLDECDKQALQDNPDDLYLKNHKHSQVAFFENRIFGSMTFNVMYSGNFQDEKNYDIYHETGDSGDMARILKSSDGSYTQIGPRIKDTHELDNTASRLVEICRDFHLE